MSPIVAACAPPVSSASEFFSLFFPAAEITFDTRLQLLRIQ